MNSRFCFLPGLKNFYGKLVVRVALVIGLFIPQSLFSQEVLLPVGNGNAKISMTDNQSGTLLWKKPVTATRTIESSSSALPLLQLPSGLENRSVDQVVETVVSAPSLPDVQGGSVRLVLYESATTAGQKVPVVLDPLPATLVSSEAEPLVPNLVPLVAPIHPVSSARDSSFGQTVPVTVNTQKSADSQGETNVFKSPFDRSANTKYTDQCPDPKTLPKMKDLTYKVVPQPGPFPESCPLPDEYYYRQAPTPITFYWKASDLCHKPSYFEEVQVERYGNAACPLLQPVISRVRFWLLIPVLPYMMGVTPPNECVYELGYYRPGSCAPHMLNPVPISLRAGLIQAGAVVGAVALIP